MIFTARSTIDVVRWILYRIWSSSDVILLSSTIDIKSPFNVIFMILSDFYAETVYGTDVKLIKSVAQ